MPRQIILRTVGRDLTDRELTGVDLFAGCGGLSLGLMKAGIPVVAALDNWIPAIDVYRENFEHPAVECDLADVTESAAMIRPFEPSLIAGGPPCQDFSSAGLRNHNGKRADLTYRFAEIVAQTSPDYFIMENVELIRRSHVLTDIVSDLSSEGYGLTAVVLDASYCGAPQARLRFFLIGGQKEPHNFLRAKLVERLRREPMTMRDYFGDRLQTEFYYRHPRNYSRRGIYGLDEPSPTIRGVNRPIPPGYVLNHNDPAGISLDEVRPLTTSERAMVQTFPEDFRFLGPKTHREQMIGNAVPVALGEFVGTALMSYLSTSSRGTPSKKLVREAVRIPKRALHKEAELDAAGQLFATA